MRAGVVTAERRGGRLDPPMLVLLDEAANICRIADLQPPDFSLTASLTSPAGPPARLPLTACGAGCWIAQPDWQNGRQLTVDVAAPGFTGGQVTLDVPWPLTPAPELLAQVQKAMGAQSTIRTRETVTSGFGTPPAHTFTLTGQEYLDDQPWSAGGATDAVVTTDPTGRTLRFALPARGYHFAFRLDEDNRVISEHIVTGNHRLERTHSYPAPSPQRPTSTQVSTPTKESR